MEPNHNIQPGHTEALPVIPTTEGLPEPESMAAAPEISQAPPLPASTSIQSTPQPDPAMLASASTNDPVPPTALMTDAMIADDADLIEKEWVERAKAIVEQTKADPHLQNKEINKVKAVYLKKRYNKDLKVDEE